MSPILMRPIREQFEHNRMIRLLQTRLRRRYMVAINVEDEREAIGVRSGAALVYPDLVLTRTTGARRLHGIVEVETAESVNHLEAMAEWVHFGKVRGAFYLYVPAGTTDIAQSLCEQYGIPVTEIWSYHAVGDQMRFTMTHRSTRAASRAAAAARRVTKTGKKTARGAKLGARTAKRAVRATRSPTTAKRTSKTAKRSPRIVRRATTTVKRAAKTAKRKTGARSGRSVAKKVLAKASSTPGRTTKKTVKGAERRAASGGKISSRASTSASRSASKARGRSTAAGTQKTAASRRLRKQR